MSISFEDLEKEMHEKKNGALAFCQQQNSLAKEKRDYVKLQSLFFEAIEERWDEITEFLITNNIVSVNAISPRTGESALLFAASNMHLYTVDLLLERSDVQKEMHLSSGNTLIFIDLERTKIDAEAFQSLMESLMQHKSLTTLYISWQKPELENTVKEMVKRLKAHNVLHNIVLANEEWDSELTILMIEVCKALEHNHINKTQKNILEATIKLSLASIVDTFEAKPDKAILALEAIKVPQVDKEVEEELRSAHVLETIEYLRKIVMLPRPQNRSTGDLNAAYQDTGQETRDGVIGGLVYFYAENGEPTNEEQGLLGLSAKNTSIENKRRTAPPITKAAVVKELYYWVDAEILEQQKKLVKNVEAQQAVANKPPENDNDGSTKNKCKA